MTNARELRIVRIPRDDFLSRYWSYRMGEHVTFIAPTGNGKTTLAFQLLNRTATPELPALVLAMKPKDKTVADFRQETGFRLVRSWPPPYSLWQPAKPRGWVLWPRHSFNPYVDNPRHAQIFSRALLDSYKRGKRIVFADEVYSLEQELGLDEETICLWTKGRSMGTGLWSATQKPTHVSLWAYNQATHLFLSYDPDKRSRDRFREIAGVDPLLIARGVEELDEYEWLYVKRAGRRSTLCIIEK